MACNHTIHKHLHHFGWDNSIEPVLSVSPGQTVEVEIHDDAIQAGEKVLLVDDLLATGGTAEAGLKLIERLGGETIGCAFVIDLPDLGGRAKLEAMGMDVHALCAFEGQ